MSLNTRDGSFVVIYSGSLEKWEEMEFLLGCNVYDSLFELLGGGFDISDVTPDEAACREILEETSSMLSLNPSDLTYFCHMVQKLPRLGKEEKGHVFYFYKKCDLVKDFDASHEHHLLSWHKLKDILTDGEKSYRTSTLRIIFHFLKYISNRKFHFGILKEKVIFKDYEF
ncbi:MAG: NUDIX domain-containing protein [Candidatus Pacebacteria bacterium]|nr:NUDIX domain-containing protein [Candidatus Paceibacterota bacterium]